MKGKGYLLFVVLNDVKKLKTILQETKKIGLHYPIVLDTIGSSNLYSSEDLYVPILASTMKSIEAGVVYNKTILFNIPEEEDVIQAMDIIDGILELDTKTTGKGILFSVPIIGTAI